MFWHRGKRQCRLGKQPLPQLQSRKVCDTLDLPDWKEIPKTKTANIGLLLVHLFKG